METLPDNQWPQRPRRTRTAFAHYVRTNYARVRQENRPITSAEVMKRLAKNWKDEPENVREDYKEMEEEDRNRYADERNAWSQKFPEGKPIRKHQKSVWGCPKRNWNSFLWFQKSVWYELRQKNPSCNQGEVIKEVAKRWKVMNEKERGPFKLMALNDKKRYEKEKAEFRWQVERRVTENKLSLMWERVRSKTMD